MNAHRFIRQALTGIVLLTGLNSHVFAEGWTEVVGLPAGRSALGVMGNLNGRLYLCGGWNSGLRTNVYRFDGANWTEVLGIPSAGYTHAMGVGVLSNYLYTVGGYNGGAGYSTNVYRFDGTNWTAVAGLPSGRSAHGVATLGNYLYAVGGGDGAYRTNVYRYNGTSWTEVSGLPVAREYFGCAVLSNYLYAIGGRGTGATIFTNVYRFDGTSWTEVAGLPAPRYAIHAGTVGGYIYAVSGSPDGATAMTNVYRFNGSTWTEVAGLPAGRFLASVGMLNGALYAAGGEGGGISCTNVWRYASSDLMAYYPFNGNANDESGNARHGTVYGATLCPDRNGNANSAYSFDGINDWISASGASLTNIPQGTVAAYIYISTYSSAVIITKGTTILADFILTTDTSKKLTAHMGTALYFTSSNDLPLATWTHVAITWDGSTWKLFINGVLDNSTATSAKPLDNDNILKIGAHYHSSGTMYYTGKIDDVRIYNRALSSNEVAEIYSDTSVAAPTGVAASDGTYTDRIRVTWSAASGASGYQLFRNTSGSTNGLSVYATTTATTYDDTSVSQGVNYYYWAKATNSSGASAFSSSDVGYVGSLDTPSSVSASDGTYTDRVRVTWNAVSGAGGYQLFRSTSNSSNGLSVYATTTSTSYDDTTVVAGTNYYYWVKATNAAGASAFSASDVGYLGSVVATLDAPTWLSASDGTYTNLVRLTWDAVSGALYYELWRNTSNNSASASVLAQTTNSVTHDDATVTPGMTYSYWVKAKNAQTTSVFSDPDSGYAALSTNTISGYANLEVSDVILLPTALEVGGHPGAVGLQLLNWGPNDLTTPNTRVILDFFLSPNATFGDGDDLWLGQYETDVTLLELEDTAVAVTASAREGFTVPSGAVGTNYVFGRARHTYPSTLGDSDESNNHAMRSGTIKVVDTNDGGGVPIPISGYHVINDYDGDGKSDLAVYQEASGKWEVLLSGSGYQTASFVFGGQGYDPVLADYDGDGKSDPAVYKESGPSTGSGQAGTWELMLSGLGYVRVSVPFGGQGYTAVAADYDGDGLADPIVYQESGGTWQIMLSGSWYGVITAALGGNGYKAVPADYDGDGKSDLAVYRRSTGEWQIMLSSLEYWTTKFQFGGSGFVPVPADYDADGKTDPGVYKDSSGEWQVMLSNYDYWVATATFGGHGYVAVPADYDGDGKGDVVVYKENAAELKILLSGSEYSQYVVGIGGPGYEPVGYYDW